MAKFKRCVTAGEMLVGRVVRLSGSVEGESTRFIERRPSIDGMPSVCVCYQIFILLHAARRAMAAWSGRKIT